MSFQKYKNAIDAVYYTSYEVMKTDRTEEDLKHTRTYSRGEIDGIASCLLMNDDITYEEKEQLELYCAAIKEKISINYLNLMEKIK